MKLPGIDAVKLYTLAEAARVLNAAVPGSHHSGDSLLRYCLSGRLPSTRFAGRGKRLVLGRDLEALIAEPSLPPGSARPRARLTAAESRAKTTARALWREHGIKLGGGPKGGA